MNIKSSQPDPDPLSELLKWATIAVVSVAIGACLAVLAYIFRFHEAGWSADPAAWGQFGDFLGGLINPIVGIITVFLVLLSIGIQRKELQSSLHELKQSNEALAVQNTAIARQNFEQTFFTWLASYRDLVSHITGKDTRLIDGKISNAPVSGKDALHASWFSTLGPKALRQTLHRSIPMQQLEVLRQHAFADETYSHQVKQIILGQWEAVYSRTEHHLDSMFRTLYRLVRWIDEQPDTFLNSEKKWHYVSIIRVQVSRIELVFLFYNGFTGRGEKFNKYLNKYAFFDNLDDDSDFAIQFMRQLKESPFEGEAYMSDLARET